MYELNKRCAASICEKLQNSHKRNKKLNKWTDIHDHVLEESILLRCQFF